MHEQNLGLFSEFEQLHSQIYDIGDILSPILGFTRLLRDQASRSREDQKFHEYIGKIAAAAEYAHARQREAMETMQRIAQLVGGHQRRS